MSMFSKNHKHGYWKEVKETLLLVAALPGQFYLVLLLEFLNTFRTGGLRFVLYTYITNEFHFSDKHAGAVLGIKGLLDVLFGLAGSILVDLIGVRHTSLFALSMAIVGRSILCFSRSSSALYVALFFFSPCGEALLGTGLYRVALKKLSTPRIRPFVFGIAYAIQNSAGVIADIFITIMRNGPDSVIMGMVFTPTRKFIIVTFISLLLSFIIAVLWLRDLTIASELDPEEGVIIPYNAKDAKGLCGCCLKNKISGYKVFDTWYGTRQIHSTYDDIFKNSDENVSSSPNSIHMISESIYWIIQQVKDLLFYTDTWRLMTFGFLVVPIGMQWLSSDLIMPPFLERRYGENVPIYMVQSINFAGCLILPPIVSALTTHMDDFRVILPGMWIMAIAPLIIVLYPTILGASLWQISLTIGEVFWSPRVLSWTARLAPTGKEGLFFALATTRAIIGPATDYFLCYLNSAYNPNCPDCRDDYGHFCSIPFELPDNGSSTSQGFVQCGSQESLCSGSFFEVDKSGGVLCPNTCMECPEWESDAQTLWSIILLLSIASPFAVWILLPFLQGEKNVNEGFYGIFDCGLHRIYNFFGYTNPDNQEPNPNPSYDGVVKSTSFDDFKNITAVDTEENLHLMSQNRPKTYYVLESK